MLQLVEMIARKEGIGELLAEGTLRAAQEIGKGAEEFAMQVKGQEVPMHEPRCKQGLGLGYTMSPTGADHCHNIHDHAYSFRVNDKMRALGIFEPVPPQELSSRKVKLVINGSLWQHVLNSLVFCQFVPLGPDKMVQLVNGITGWNTDYWELLKVGERCITMSRAFNNREGKTKADDWLPKRYLTPFDSGPLEGIAIKENELAEARDTYYAMVGWDNEGKPTRAKLQELGIEWVADA
jgi:aldehyde:ferredoxin oxidoreductase